VNERAFRDELVDAASTPYRRAGAFAWHFARGKVRSDPVYLGILKLGLIAPNARVLDLGCGQGLIASTLLAADALCRAGAWPAAWPPAPTCVQVRGVELMSRDVERARRALADRVTIEQQDIRTADYGTADAVVILDVLHYLTLSDQEAVLTRARKALSADGMLVLRVGDAGAGLPFLTSLWVDRIVTFVRGHRTAAMHCRTLTEWTALLERLGFVVVAVPMSTGTPFANVLLAGRKAG
jgi:cyclopropane fatty-acyl-phospholipid synthase-like methyltransferase